MTIVYTKKKIHSARNSLIIVPTTTNGMIYGSAVEDLILHKQSEGLTHPMMHNVKPGTISYKYNKTNTFAYCFISHTTADYDERLIAHCLNLVKEYAIEVERINDIAIDLSSFVIRKGGWNIIKMLNKIFPEYTITVYIGFPHFAPENLNRCLKKLRLLNFNYMLLLG